MMEIFRIIQYHAKEVMCSIPLNAGRVLAGFVDDLKNQPSFGASAFSYQSCYFKLFMTKSSRDVVLECHESESVVQLVLRGVHASARTSGEEPEASEPGFLCHDIISVDHSSFKVLGGLFGGC